MSLSAQVPSFCSRVADLRCLLISTAPKSPGATIRSLLWRERTTTTATGITVSQTAAQSNSHPSLFSSRSSQVPVSLRFGPAWVLGVRGGKEALSKDPHAPPPRGSGVLWLLNGLSAPTRDPSPWRAMQVKCLHTHTPTPKRPLAMVQRWHCGPTSTLQISAGAKQTYPGP